MLPPAHILSLCRRWCAAAPVSVVPLGVPGFSGSRVFAVELPDAPGRFVLKSFHAAATVGHARFVHQLVRHVRIEGISHVPEVIPTLDGDTLVRDADGRLWELSRFMFGAAVPRPTASQASAAATALARLHLAAATLPGHPPVQHASPGLERRIDQSLRLQARPWHSCRATWSHSARQRMPMDVCAALDARVAEAAEIFAAAGGDAFVARVATLAPRCCVLQPVLRDVWCDHVLFADEADDVVTAIIDLHAAGTDTPATDLARLVGSWDAPAGGERLSLADRWPEAFAAYASVRPLSAFEAALIPTLHATGVVLGLDNWFRWVFEEQRDFPDMRRMLDRIDRLLAALPAAMATAWSDAGNVD